MPDIWVFLYPITFIPHGDFPGSPVVKNLPSNEGNVGWIPGWGIHCCLVPKSRPTLCDSMAYRFPCVSLSPTVCSNSYPLSWCCCLTILSSDVLFFCLQSFTASGSSNESSLRIRWPKFWSFSFSIIPTNESVQFSSVQLLSHVQLFVTPWIAAYQASLSIINSWSSPKLMSIESLIPSSHLIL